MSTPETALDESKKKGRKKASKQGRMREKPNGTERGRQLTAPSPSPSPSRDVVNPVPSSNKTMDQPTSPLLSPKESERAREGERQGEGEGDAAQQSPTHPVEMESPEAGPSVAAAERPSEAAALRALVDRVRSGEVEAAREVRRLTRSSSRHRRKLAAAVEPLVAMLRSGAPDAGEAALLALLNLAVRDERNKIKIVDAGALEPLLGYLQSSDLNLQEYATAALLTLSASSTNKPIISASGAIPLLVKVLKEGNPQAKNDAVMALYNLSTITDNLQIILSVQPIPPLIELLKGGKRSSKTADKCCALLESLLAFDQGRVALTSEEDGVLTIVEVLEEGSVQGREHAVGALLTMCESDRSKYRDLILNEGAIPGLLELTVHGTPKSRVKAHVLLDLLRNSPYSRSKLQADTLENIVSNIASQIDGDDRGGKAKKMLAEMVKVSMEQSLRHLQRRASFA